MRRNERIPRGQIGAIRKRQFVRWSWGLRSWELAIDNVNLSAESEEFVGAEIKVGGGGGQIGKKDEWPHKAQRFKAEGRGS